MLVPTHSLMRSTELEFLFIVSLSRGSSQLARASCVCFRILEKSPSRYPDRRRRAPFPEANTSNLFQIYQNTPHITCGALPDQRLLLIPNQPNCCSVHFKRTLIITTTSLTYTGSTFLAKQPPYSLLAYKPKFIWLRYWVFPRTQHDA